MNMQIRFTPIEERENQIHLQELQRQAEQDHLAEGAQAVATPVRPARRLLWRAVYAVGHRLWVVGDELALELADVLHGHRPHRHHHAH